MKLKKDPLKFQKIQNSYREYSNKKKLENRPPQKWAFWGPKAPSRARRAPGARRAPSPPQVLERRGAVGPPNFLVTIKLSFSNILNNYDCFVIINCLILRSQIKESMMPQTRVKLVKYHKYPLFLTTRVYDYLKQT